MPSTQPEFAWFNGGIVPWNEARVHVFSPVVKYGTGIFEGLRGYWNAAEGELYVFRLAEHLDRLAFGLKVMRFDPGPDRAEMERAVLEVLRANRFRGPAHIRLSVFLEGDGEMSATGPVGMACTAIHRPPTKAIAEGLAAGVVSWRRPEDSSQPMRVKANANYQNGRFAVQEARTNGYGAAILLNSRGKVAEGPGMCLFMVRDGVVITPSITNDILESITRDAVIRLLREDLGVTVEERDVDRTELYAADEAFFCGTAWEVTPITSVDRLAVGDGRVGALTSRVQARYFGIADGSIAARAAWRTPVYGASPDMRATQ
ncbi:branched-chain amino acid transaminase [Elioraea sp.]|uniref:branched-chain amino acid transaminase n=1 Tax=Elioraea sp. TaxID=2185103 RepID=UPI0025C1CAFB|nr:branched-chain amino acid transaminase [Elioraea sp.]